MSPAENEGFLVHFFYFFLPCLVPECWGAEGRRSALINIAGNMQLLALGDADSILGVTREHPFHLPRIFGDVFFFYPHNKSQLLGGGGPTILPAPLPSLLPFREAKTRHDRTLPNTSSS